MVAYPSAGQDRSSARVWGALSTYPYLDRVKDDVDLTLTLNARFSKRATYFSYQNFRGVLSSGDARFDRSEQNFRWAVSEKLPIDLNLQAIILKGSGNDQWHVGVGWRLNDTSFMREFFERLNLRYRVTLHLKRFASAHDDALLLQHSFKTSFPRESGRFYLSGWLTQTFNSDFPDSISNNPFVTEIQFGARISGNFNAVAEYRINQFRTSENHNFAVGIEYSFRW